MSKRAEEKAIEYQLKTYGPVVLGGDGILSDEEFNVFNINKDYKNGYEEAEKDLALTADDIRLITKIHYNLVFNDVSGVKVGDVAEEVLRRFVEFKNK